MILVSAGTEPSASVPLLAAGDCDGDDGDDDNDGDDGDGDDGDDGDGEEWKL